MKKFFIPGLLAAAAMTVACADLSDLESRMDSLESRVKALETQVEALNKNVAATSSLLEAGTINSVTEKDGVYTLLLSDGTSVTLTQGSIGVGNAPVMSVDKDGYWMVDYGTGKNYVMNGTEKVKAKGADGVTPVFGVNATGNWTVSYDGGTTFQEVKDPSGKPVSALPGGGEVSDPYFKEVKYEGGLFTLVLKDGTSLEVPVVAGFLCSIAGAESIQTFSLGETRTFAVTMEGVAETVLTAPDGWKAALNESILSVTAPLTVTKATLADSRTDVSILALSASGHAAVAKVKVALDDAPIPVTPIAAVTAGEAGETSVSFTVTLSDASAWKYLVRKASEAAPSAEYVNESGIAGEGSGATVSGLEEGTEYVVYVLPLNGAVSGSLAKVSMTTKVAAISDYYEAYNAGKDIVICGVTYNKATNGEAVLVSATEASTNFRTTIHQKGGVFFLECSDGAFFETPTITEITSDVVLISRYADKPATLKQLMCFKLKSGSLVMKNITCDMSGINGGTNATYAFNNANSTADLDRLHFEDCRFLGDTRSLLYASKADTGFKSVIVRGCLFQLAYTSGNVQLFNFYKSTVLHTYKELVFENNIVFNATCTAVQVFQYDQNIAQAGSPWECTLNARNNIFYNCPSANGYFKFYQLASLNMNGNIFWGDPSSTLASYGFILYSASQAATAVDATGNIAYGLAEGKNWLLAHTNSTVVPEGNTMAKLEEDPFESFNTGTGDYTLKAAYASYGPRN
ncbi:MAG: hypothetical protein IJM35_06790 [Bacteroidales bacterium]|nr:hypothetical protein [Bacteroidales bacterium]